MRGSAGSESSDHPVITKIRQYRMEVLFSLAFLLVTAVVFRDYFAHPNPLGTDSMGLPFIITYSDLHGEFFSNWISFSGLGFPDYPLPIYQTIYMVATGVGASPLAISKTLMVISFWTAGVAMFICARRLTGSTIGAIAAAAVFSFNQVFLSQVIDGHYYFVLSYALFPFIFLIFYDLLRGRESRYFFLAPIVLGAFGTLAPPNIVLIAVMFLGLFALLQYVVKPFPPRRLLETGAFILIILAFLGLSVVLANNIPTYNTSYPIQEAMRWSSSSLLDGLTLKASENSFFYGNQTDAWVQPSSLTAVADIAALVVPIVAFSSVIWKQHRRSTIPLAVIALIFTFLAKGPNEPLSGVFNWAFNYVPLFDTIRVYSRFSLFTSFAYGVMIAFTILGFHQASWQGTGLRGTIHKHRVALTAALAVLVGACVLVQSGAILSGAVGSYDLAPEYQAPFDWVGEQEGDFRILNLPFMADYHNGPSLYGYPNTTTIDPGIYSIMYTGKDTVYGASTYDFWYYFGQAVDGHAYGYRQTASILGATASMRYVVVQPHTPEDERAAYLSMIGLAPVATMEGGGMVLENDNWSPRALAYGNISMATGGRDMLTALAGMGLYQPGSEALVFVDQLDQAQFSHLLDVTDYIYLANGDLTELYMDLADWPSGQDVLLYERGASHTTDDSAYWVKGKAPMKDGLTLNPTLLTTGRTSVTVSVDASGPGTTLYLKLLRTPEGSNVTVRVPGLEPQTFDTRYPVERMSWVPFRMSDAQGAVEVTLDSDGSGVINLERMVTATDEQMDEQVQNIDGMLAGHLDKLAYVYLGTSYFEDAQPLLGGDGWGVLPLSDAITLKADGEFDGQQRLMVATMNTTDPLTVTVDGIPAPEVSSFLGSPVYDLGSLIGGENISIGTSGIYGAAIMNGDGMRDNGGAVEVSYEHPHIGTYKVSLPSNGPWVVQVSENYNTWWKVQGNGSVTQVPLNSIVNGYLIEGNSTVTIEYGGNQIYPMIIGILVLVLAMATALMVIKRYRPSKKGADD